MMAIERGEHSVARSRSYARTVGINCAWGTTRLTSLISNASAASMMRPDKRRSSAFWGPTRRGSIQLIPCSAIRPRGASARAGTEKVFLAGALVERLPLCKAREQRHVGPGAESPPRAGHDDHPHLGILLSRGPRMPVFPLHAHRPCVQ